MNDMNYLIVQPHPKVKQLSQIRVVLDGTDLPLPYEAWPLDTGKKIMLVNGRLGKLLASYHMGGSFDRGASYAYTYEDMCRIMQSLFGLSERDTYRAALMEKEALVRRFGAPRTSHAEHQHMVLAIGGFVFKVMGGVINFVLNQIIIATVLGVLRKRR